MNFASMRTQGVCAERNISHNYHLNQVKKQQQHKAAKCQVGPDHWYNIDFQI